MCDLCIWNSPGSTRIYLGEAVSMNNEEWGGVGKVKNGTFERNELDQHLKLCYIASGQADI